MWYLKWRSSKTFSPVFMWKRWGERKKTVGVNELPLNSNKDFFCALEFGFLGQSPQLEMHKYDTYPMILVLIHEMTSKERNAQFQIRTKIDLCFETWPLALLTLSNFTSNHNNSQLLLTQFSLFGGIFFSPAKLETKSNLAENFWPLILLTTAIFLHFFSWLSKSFKYF